MSFSSCELLADPSTVTYFMSNVADLMVECLVSPLLSTVLIGISTGLALTSTCILISAGLGHRAYQLQLCATVVLYTSTMIFWVASLKTTLAVIRSEICSLGGLVAATQIADLACLQTASLTINIIVGDAIVWWRASVLCQWTGRSRYAILSLCFVVLSSTFGPGHFGEGELFSGIKLGAAASVLTLLSNLITVALTSYKACCYVKLRNMVASRERRATQVQKTLTLLIESGFIYCAIWILVSTWQVGINVPALDYDAWAKFSILMGYFIEGALVPIIAIYPMVIIVMVALKKSSGASVSVSMPASSALVAQRCEAHAERLRNGTSYPMMTLAQGRGPSNSELAEEESIEDKREVIEIV